MTTRELQAAPRLAPLYAKALLPRSEGDSLPDTEYLRTGIEIDPAHLAAYNQVCEFRLADELPVTYPHMLAFPLQMALMTQQDFPFPLLGMVHVANRITQHRPVRLGERTSMRVRAQNLRPHEKGSQFDVLSELSTEDGVVWSEVSTYLRRGGGSGSSSGAQLAAPSPNAIWRVPGDIGRRYAEVSGDRNPIHLHPLTAKLFGFPSAIAHGMWTKARVLAAFEGRLPDAYTVDVRFKLPVLLPAKVAFTSWRTGDGWAFELWNAKKPKPHLEGTIS
ncbi:MaoC family dehydratase [Amycolatopsis sp.]|uniref:MaoC family dehydratase n=1 Tax=Amycolatopsis sp. TaxID=37632 RepID=UPI002BB8EB69|nr:MaoC/PaaZ C-terminal domain-containing protein [Amycolatopsis sp.]HVV13995.1 MaoC/PaaZ C-terminal domain-containing protein [Amycolatopsis sp.]